MIVEVLYFVWILLMFTLHLSTPVGKVRFVTIISPSPFVNLHLGAWGWCDQVIGVCHGPEVGYNFTTSLAKQLRFKELPGDFSADTRVHGMLPAVLAWGLVTLVLSLLAIKYATDALQVFAIYGSGLLAVLSTIYSAIVWKWARDLNATLKGHTKASVHYSHGYWLLIPIFVIPYLLTIAEWFRAREWEEMPFLQIGDVYVPSTAAPSIASRRSARAGSGTGGGRSRSRSVRGATIEPGNALGLWPGAVPNAPAPERHRPTYTFFPEPEGEYNTYRVGRTPPPSGFWGRAYEGSSTTTYPSSGSTVYPPPHWGQY